MSIDAEGIDTCFFALPLLPGCPLYIMYTAEQYYRK